MAGDRTSGYPFGSRGMSIHPQAIIAGIHLI